MGRLADGRYRFESPEELPAAAVSFASTAWNKTGAWRSREPVFSDLRPPCVAACPTAQDIVDQMGLVAQGRTREAGEVLLAANPFPATTGRVCPHPCTAACNRTQLDGAVDIPGVERAIGDALLADGFRVPAKKPNGARVAIVGAGPAGLTAGYYLALAGARVALYDRADRPGGLLGSGIPPYRLPREVMEAEVARALGAGISFFGNRSLGSDLALEPLEQENDAVVLAMGRHAPRALGLPGEDARGVADGLGLLRSLFGGEPAPEGNRVVVIGGGNTAMDCARSLRRLGREVTVAYRRDRAAMPAFAEEIDEAIEEGVRLEERALPVALRVEDGAARAVRFVRTQPGRPDASGRARPEPVAASEFDLDADLIVVAAGEGLDPVGLGPALLARGFVGVDGALSTPLDRVWACGDCTGATGTVAEAVLAGRRVAAAVAKSLSLEGPAADVLGDRGASTSVAGFERLHAFYFTPAPGVLRGRRDPNERLGGGEVRRGFDSSAARTEAARCLACGTCTGCNNCFNFCPDRAVVPGLPGRYAVDVARCKGCGICVEECPHGAVSLRELGASSGD